MITWYLLIKKKLQIVIILILTTAVIQADEYGRYEEVTPPSVKKDVGNRAADEARRSAGLGRRHEPAGSQLLRRPSRDRQPRAPAAGLATAAGR